MPLSSVSNFLDVTSFSAAIIIRIIYGHEVVSDNDYYVKIVTETAHCVTKCAPPGSNIVDLLPISCAVFIFTITPGMRLLQ